MKKILVILLLSLTSYSVYSQKSEARLPIIDMHLHASTASGNGPPPTAICAPPTEMPHHDPSNNWMETFTQWLKNPECENAIWGPATDKELMEQTLEILERRNIYAMTCGQYIDDYIKNGGQRIIPGLDFSFGNTGLTPDKVRELLSSGKFKVFGEIGIQYNGISPSDSTFEPYLKIAEELDIPIGIHMGPGPPGAPYLPGVENYRAKLHSPLLIEEALLRHPKLRVYLMHAGWPKLDDLIALLWVHPQVYVDVGVICYAIPRPEFYAYLKRIAQAGFGKRIMFGSDQMNWPGAIEVGIEAIETAEFLSEGQKRDILYNNAARFLRLSEEVIAKHHLE